MSSHQANLFKGFSCLLEQGWWHCSWHSLYIWALKGYPDPLSLNLNQHSSDLDTSVIYPQWGMKNVFLLCHFSFNPSGICCRVQNTNLPNCCRARGLGFRVQGKTGGADDHSLIPSIVIESLWLYVNQRRPAHWSQRWGPIIQDFFVFSLIGEFIRSPRDLAMDG